MKKILLTLTAIVAFAVSASAQSLPNVSVQDRNGKEIMTKELLGKPMIVSFWAITCKPCIMELNAMNDMYYEWLEEADFNIVAVSIDDVRSSSRAKAMSSDWEFICLFDLNQDLKRAMNVSLTPQTFIVDAKGNIVYSHSGYTPGSEVELFEKIKELAK